MEVSEEVKKSLKKADVYPHRQSWGKLFKNPFDLKETDFSKTVFTISLDMVEMMGSVHIKEDIIESEILEYCNEVKLLKRTIGTPMFKSVLDIYLHGENFGTISCHPRKLTKILKPESASLRIANHMLYTEGWYGDLLQVIDALDYRKKNDSRIDVCIDGLNHIPDLLNAFNKQQGGSKKIIKMLGRGNFASKILDKEKMYYKNFQIGSSSSEKQITVYLKTSELLKSNKQYIRDFWNLNHLSSDSDVYRTELRMRSGYLNSIKNFGLDKCTEPEYLFKLFKLGCHNFFEFVIEDGTQIVTRKEKIKFLPQHFMKDMALLDRVKKTPSDGTYKIKMTVHQIVRDIFKGVIEKEDAINAINHAKKCLDNYRLNWWFDDRINDWNKMYGSLMPPGENKEEDLKKREQLENLMKSITA